MHNRKSKFPFEKRQRFSIRKFNVGVASVAISAFLLMGGAVSADEIKSNETEESNVEVVTASLPPSIENEVSSSQEETVSAATEEQSSAKETTLTVEEVAQPEEVVKKEQESSAKEVVPAPKKESQPVTQSLPTISNSQAEETTIPYTVVYVDQETDAVVKSEEKTAPAKLDTKTLVTEEAQIPEGYELVQGQDIQLTKEIHQLQKNVLSFALVKKKDEFSEELDQEAGIQRKSGFRNTGTTSTNPDRNFEKYRTGSVSRLAGQIAFLDFNDRTALSNVGPNNTLQVGTKFVKEIAPGYTITLEVKRLRPFNATEIYRDRGGKHYNAQAKNAVLSSGAAASIVLSEQHGLYSSARRAGLNTGGRTVIESSVNGANVGVEFSVKATLNGRDVPANVVMMTGEEPNRDELELYTTDGDNFELLTELSNNSTVRSYLPNADPNAVPSNAKYTEGFWTRSTYMDPGWVNPVISATQRVSENQGRRYGDGIGSKVFGPIYTGSDQSVPVVLTRNARNVGVYLNSAGKQGAMLGFLIVDAGDAPSSYGEATHTISKGANHSLQQPYLGQTPPDIDIRTASDVDWTSDDTSGSGDEGTAQLLGTDPIIDKDGNNTGGNYPLQKAGDDTYQLTVLANNNGTAPAYARAFIDFNGDGKFDEEAETSAPVRVTGEGPVTFTFRGIPQNIDTTQVALGGRVRIALDESDVQKATGFAYSGEVEDFQIQQTIPPRGVKKETSGPKGEKQTAQVTFTAYGKRSYDVATDNELDTARPYKFIVNGQVSDETTLNVPNEGSYQLNPTTGDIVFTPEPDFVGTAKGVAVRAWDKNGAHTGWTADTAVNKLVNTNQVDGKTMDSSYIPTVVIPELNTEDKATSGLQGQVQKATLVHKRSNDQEEVRPSAEYPAKLIDPATNKRVDAVTIQGQGAYQINPETGEITFTPEKRFTGTATAISVELEAPVGTDRTGTPVLKVTRGTYTPTVNEVTPTGSTEKTTGEQGVAQSAQVTFQPGHEEVPLDPSVPVTFEDGSTTKTLAEGEYSLAEDGTVTFTPKPDFVGEGTELFVIRKDMNGTIARGSYKATVTPDTEKPTLDSVADQTVSKGDSLTVPITASDNIGDPTVTVDGLPEGLSYDSARKEIVGTVSAAQGDYPVTVTATDAAGNTTTQQFTIHVTDKDNLKQAVNDQSDVTQTDNYVEADSDKKQAYDKAVKEAETVLANKKASQADIDEAKAKVDAAKENLNGQKNLQDGANQELDEAANAKKKAIDARDDLTQEEKDAAKAQIDKVVEDAKKNIAAATDKATANDAKNVGANAITAVNPEAVAKPTAKAAIDKAAADKKAAIDARNDLTQEEKDKAKSTVDEEADKAKDAVDAATDQAGVDAAKDSGTGEIAKVNPEAAAKPAAKEAIDKAAADKKAAIDANNDLTQEEKDAAKATV
ncbi:DUF1542 domain-containing protein, partial [Streptococcus danieliae]|nr:DUF1542 domain-containing protein [Streptococcus danieliae]